MSGSTSAGSSAAQSAAWRTGLGVLTEATGTDRAGNIRTVAAAVLLDADGKLAGVTLDELELSVSADGTGKVTTPTDTRTKRQKGKDYPLAEVSGLKKGWAEQADAFGSWLEGKTPEEVKKLKTDADGKPTDADLLSGCTIAVERYRDAVVRACENAQVLGAARGDTVKLGVEVAEMPQGLAGTDDKDAQVQAKITLAVVTMDENARVTSAIGDMTEPELTVSADGTVSAPREPVYTKNELGDRYGMRSASALGKEWYEHSAGWCGYLKGKNAVEIGKLSADGTDADLKALCTISVTDLQKAVLKAMAEQSRTIWNARRVRFGHNQRKNYFLFRDSGASADAPLSHFHGRGREGKRHLQRLLPTEAAALREIPPQALTRQIPPFVTCGDIFPRPGEVFPQGDALWRCRKVSRHREKPSPWGRWRRTQ